MITHPFWGNVEEDWAGLSVEHPVSLPDFRKPILVFLGPEEPEDELEVADMLSGAQLDDYEATWKQFLAQAPACLQELKQQTFAYYQRYYAGFYEDPARSGEPSLILTTAEQHFTYLQDVEYLRITDGRTLRFVIHYGLDSEHGLEVKFVANEIADIGGIADT